MKIAVYHNLKSGGAIKMLNKIVSGLSTNNIIDIYCHEKILNSKNIRCHIFKLKPTKNIFEHLDQIDNELYELNKKIADIINKKNYDLILVFQCILTQSPYILRFLRSSNTIYFLNEPKREFYEQTTYSYFKLKRIIARILRYRIKYIDRINASYAKNIITCSYYSSHIIEKIYNKKSYVVYPGLEKISPIAINKKNYKKIMSIGPFQKIKGHLFSLNQITGYSKKITIFGRSGEDEKFLNNQAQKNKLSIIRQKTYSDVSLRKAFYDNNIYLANNEKEPFGIATLEASDSNLYLLGKNEAGTSEIVNIINGGLYKNDLKLAKTIFKIAINKEQLIFYKTCKINWEDTINNILKIYHSITQTPNV